MCTYIYIYIYICIFIYVNTYTHVWLYVPIYICPHCCALLRIPVFGIANPIALNTQQQPALLLTIACADSSQPPALLLTIKTSGGQPGMPCSTGLHVGQPSAAVAGKPRILLAYNASPPTMLHLHHCHAVVPAYCITTQFQDMTKAINCAHPSEEQ